MYIDKENFVAWMERIMDRIDMQERKIDRLLSEHNYLNGEKLLDNQDLCFMLKVSTKTLQRYRKKGILPYIMLDGKYFYRASDIHKLIRERTDLVGYNEYLYFPLSCRIIVIWQDFCYLQGYSGDFRYFCKSNIRE